MVSFLLYIIESTLCLAVLYLFYRCCFRNDTWFRANRLLLLIGSVLCVGIPFCRIEVNNTNRWQQPLYEVRQWLSGASSAESEVTGELLFSLPADKGTKENNGNAQPAHGNLLIIIYLLGAIGVAGFLLFSVHRLQRLTGKYPYRYYKGHWLTICPELPISFSWGNSIVLSQEDYDCYRDTILLHEEMHLRYRHTWDLLWMHLLLILHWFNPAVWLLLRALRELHEYEADRGVLRQGIDATQYQLLLVQKSVGPKLYSMACAFGHSKLKKRITMMLKKRTSSRAHLKLLLAVPLTAGMLYAFAQPEVKKTVAEIARPLPVRSDTTGLYDCELLEQYFQRRLEEFAKGGGDIYRIGQADRHAFFVNMNNGVMVDEESNCEAHAAQDIGQNSLWLRERLSTLIKEGKACAVREHRTYQPLVEVYYDSGTSLVAMRAYLRVLKELPSQPLVRIYEPHVLPAATF